MHRRSFLWTMPGLAAGSLAAQPAQVPATGAPAQDIAAKYCYVDSAVVVRGGQVLFEHYRDGGDADALRDVQSVTKSVLSLAVEAALGSGALRSLDLAIATTATVSADSNARGQAMTPVRNELFQVAAAARPGAEVDTIDPPDGRCRVQDVPREALNSHRVHPLVLIDRMKGAIHARAR